MSISRIIIYLYYPGFKAFDIVNYGGQRHTAIKSACVYEEKF